MARLLILAGRKLGPEHLQAPRGATELRLGPVATDDATLGRPSRHLKFKPQRKTHTIRIINKLLYT